jgi:hypothetical protein
MTELRWQVFSKRRKAVNKALKLQGSAKKQQIYVRDAVVRPLADRVTVEKAGATGGILNG